MGQISKITICLLVCFLTAASAHGRTLSGSVDEIQKFDQSLDALKLGTFFDDSAIPKSHSIWYCLPYAAAGQWVERGSRVQQIGAPPVMLLRTTPPISLGKFFDSLGNVWDRAGTGMTWTIDQHGRKTVFFETTDSAGTGSDGCLYVNKHGKAIQLDTDGTILDIKKITTAIRYVVMSSNELQTHGTTIDAQHKRATTTFWSNLTRAQQFKPLNNPTLLNDLNAYLSANGLSNLILRDQSIQPQHLTPTSDQSFDH